jgi:acyl carrier protein
LIPQDIEQQLVAVFHRALRTDAGRPELVAGDLSAWDSLTHIKLIMELETSFGITIGPDDIPTLYKDFDTVATYVSARLDRD